jgi:hypothetical protein
MDPLADDMLWQVQVEIFTRDVGDALAAVDWRAYRRVVLDEHRREAVTGALQGSVATPRTRSDN